MFSVYFFKIGENGRKCLYDVFIYLPSRLRIFMKWNKTIFMFWCLIFNRLACISKVCHKRVKIRSLLIIGRKKQNNSKWCNLFFILVFECSRNDYKIQYKSKTHDLRTEIVHHRNHTFSKNLEVAKLSFVLRHIIHCLANKSTVKISWFKIISKLLLFYTSRAHTHIFIINAQNLRIIH